MPRHGSVRGNRAPPNCPLNGARPSSRELLELTNPRCTPAEERDDESRQQRSPDGVGLSTELNAFAATLELGGDAGGSHRLRLGDVVGEVQQLEGNLRRADVVGHSHELLPDALSGAEALKFVGVKTETQCLVSRGSRLHGRMDGPRRSSPLPDPDGTVVEVNSQVAVRARILDVSQLNGHHGVQTKWAERTALQ